MCICVSGASRQQLQSGSAGRVRAQREQRGWGWAEQQVGPGAGRAAGCLFSLPSLHKGMWMEKLCPKLSGSSLTLSMIWDKSCCLPCLGFLL